MPLYNSERLVFSRKKKYKELLDRELVAIYKTKGNMQALGELFERYTHLVASLAMGILKNEESAKEVVQEIFEVVVKDLKKHDVKNFNAWIFSVTKFHCFKKKKQIEITKADIEIEEKEDFDELLEQELLLQKRIEVLNKSLKELKNTQKQCLELFYLKGHSYQEIANETALSLKDVKSSIQNGKRNLKNMMYNHE